MSISDTYTGPSQAPADTSTTTVSSKDNSVLSVDSHQLTFTGRLSLFPSYVVVGLEGLPYIFLALHLLYLLQVVYKL